MQKEQITCKTQTNVGITEFLSKGQPIEGIMKYLISDFIVNEVDANNNLVMFKSKEKALFNKQEQDNESPKLTLTQQKKKILATKLSQESIEALSTLYDRLDIKEKINKWSIEIDCPESKQQRTQLHQFIREHLPFIESKNDQGKFTLTFAKVFKRFKKTNDYLHFKLMKSNIDTPGAIFKLSKILNVNPKLFSVAGLKDKRGITTQMVSLYNCEPQLFNKFYKVADRTRQIWIGEPVEHQDEKVHLGDLMGNKFALCIRFIKSRQQILPELQQNLNNLKKNGFINYFGMQRFGSRQIGTHMIGVQVIKKNFKDIIEMLVLQQTRDEQINKLKKEIWETKNYRKGNSLPNKYQIEKNLFYSLQRHGQNYAVVFQTLPRTNRSLYGHALQSFLWNRIVSKRIRTYGVELKVGDFVAKNKKKQEVAEGDEQQNLNEGEQVEEESFEVQKITQQNIKNYTAYDLLIPLYGSETIADYPPYLVDFVSEQLKELGLEPQMFITGLPKSLMLTGGYRKMINTVQDLSWNVTNHHLKDEQLQNGFYYNEEDKVSTQGKYFSLRVRFILSKSCYATMAIRELLKAPSSFQHQEILNKKYKALE